MYIGLNNLGLNSNQAAFSPLSLFTAGEQGGWWDPSDLSTMYQDSAGTSPVTAVGQPVGFIADKRLGLAMGSELRSTGAGGFNGAAAAATYNTATGVGTATRVDVSNCTYLTFPTSAISTYFCDVENTGAASFSVRNGSGTPVVQVNVGQRITCRVVVGAELRIMPNTDGTTINFTVHSIRALPGNHRTQSTAASRPTLSGRYNLLTKSEDISDAVWAKNNATTSGTSGLQETAINHFHQVVQNYTLANGVSYTLVADLAAGTRSWAFVTFYDGAADRSAYFDLANVAVGTLNGGVTATITDLGGGLRRCVVRGTAAGTTGQVAVGAATGDGGRAYLGVVGANAIVVDGIDLRATADASLAIPSYQRVNTATDYDTAGFPLYLSYDGVDDWMSTASVDFSATDKMTLIAGVHKASDASRCMFVELGAGAGSFALNTPNVAAGNTVVFANGGTTTAQSSISNSVAPVSFVATGIGDIGGDVCQLRYNGVARPNDATDQGTGNYRNDVLYFGRRGGTTLPFNGREYGTIIRGVTTSSSLLLAAERFVGYKMGIFL